jgi:subtilisin-like proprotein convertase family protein
MPAVRTRLKLIAALLIGLSARVLFGQLSETNNFSNVNLPIPDGLTSGIHDVRTVTSDIAFITSVRVRLNISGNYNGDLYGYLRHGSGFSVLLNRAGRSSTNQFGYHDTGLNLTLADAGTSDIHNYRSFVVPVAGSALTGAWQPDARYVHPGASLNTSTRSAFLSAFTGLNANGTWTLFLADVDAGATNFLNSWALEITGNPRIKPIVTWTNPSPITYPTPVSSTQLNASANVPGVFSYSPPAGTVLNAGSNQTLTVTFIPNDTTNYQTVTTNISLTVLKKALTITANDEFKTYGAALPTFTASYSGFVPGEGPANLLTPVSFSTSATVSSTIGSYPIIPSGATAQNYAITFVNGTLTIAQAFLTVTANDSSRAYGAANPLFTGSLTGVQNGDNITATYATSAATNSSVGSYAIVPSLIDPGGKLTNYVVTSTNGTLTVSAAQLTVAADNAARSYGQTNPVFSGTLFGVQNGDDITASFTTSATTNSPVGTYNIAPVLNGPTGKLPNYTVISSNGVLTVGAANLVGNVVNATRLYGETNPVFTVSYTGFVNGEDSNIISGTLETQCSAETNSPAGEYPITASGQTAPNYIIQYVDGVLTVEPALLLVRAIDATRPYGQTNPPFSATISGFVNGEDTNVLGGTLTFSTPASGTSAVGVYPITPEGLTATNYSIVFSNGTLTVTAYSLFVGADDYARSYGQDNPAFTGTLIGLQNGDNITTAYSTSAASNSPVGVYPILPSLNNPEGKLVNYTVFATNGALTIEPASITITANNKAKAFGEAMPELTASYVGFLFDDDTNTLMALLTLTTTASETSDVGIYAISASGALASNYVFNYVAGTLTITQALTAGGLTGSGSPAAPGDSVTFTLSLNAVAPGAGFPVGTIDFFTNGNLAGTSTLTNGVASLTLDTLEPGTHEVVSEYPGSLNFAGVTNTLIPAQIITATLYAGPDTLERRAAQGVKVSVGTLLKNDFSADTNGFALQSFDATSASGGTLTLREGWIFYEPPAGFTNDDGFAYVITNNIGLSVTGAVSVVVAADLKPAENLTRVLSLTNGSQRLEFQGIPGRTYSIQFTELLEPADWQPLGAGQADESGWFEFVDTPPTNAPPRFYRATFP